MEEQKTEGPSLLRETKNKLQTDKATSQEPEKDIEITQTLF